MSIHPNEWSTTDDEGNKPDVNMLHDRYFNTDDGYIWRVNDFVKVQVQSTLVDVPAEGKNLGYQQTVPGKVLWHVILNREGDPDKPRLGMLYADFEVSLNYHKVKDPSGKPKPVYRGLTPDQQKEAATYDHPRHMIDAGRVRGDDVIGRTVELSSRQRPSSVDHSTGATRGVVKGPHNVDQGAADFDHTGDSVMLAERENPSGDWKPSPMERERIRGGAAAMNDD